MGRVRMDKKWRSFGFATLFDLNLSHDVLQEQLHA